MSRAPAKRAKNKVRRVRIAKVASNRGLAEAIGVDEKSVRKYLEREEWPFARKPPWTLVDVEKIKRWRRELQEDRSAEREPPADAQQQKAVELAPLDPLKFDEVYEKRIKLLALRDPGKYETLLDRRSKRLGRDAQMVDRRLLDGALEGLSRRFVDFLDDLERSIPLRCAGLDPGQMERAVHDLIRAARERLASQQMLEARSIDQALKQQALPRARGRPKSAA